MPDAVSAPTPPTVADMRAAGDRLRGVAVRTPLLESPELSAALGGRLLVKAECLQRTGSFKIRGAYSRLSLVPEAERYRGAVAFSSGNHAQGVAEAARLLGMPATIVMPDDAPEVKRAGTEARGARVVSYDRTGADREAIARGLADETGAVLVHPYDDPGVVAGQGTVGLEIADQAREIGVTPDAVVVCCGGGGLSAGITAALAETCPDATVHTAEPAGFDDMARSLAAGDILANPPDSRSICDAVLTRSPGRMTFAMLHGRVGPGAVVADAEAAEAMRVAFARFKLVVEPGGAVALAAALTGRVPVAGRVVVATLSGGGVDPALYARIIGGASA